MVALPTPAALAGASKFAAVSATSSVAPAESAKLRNVARDAACVAVTELDVPESETETSFPATANACRPLR